MAYIAFDFIVKSGLKEEIENLHKNMDLLLQSQREQENNMNDLMRQGKAVKEENDLRKELDRLQLQQEIAKSKMDAFSEYSKTNDDTLKDLHNDMDLLLKSQREQENNMNDLKRQGKAVKEENEHLRKELDRLQLQQEIAKIKMDAFSDYSKTNDDTLKDMKKGFLFFKDDIFRDTLKEIQRLLNQVTKMDEEISKLGENYKAVSDQLKRLQNGRF